MIPVEPDNVHRTVVVTGAARGLGEAMARGLLTAGHRVVAVDADPVALSQFRATIGMPADRVAVSCADITDPAVPRSLVDLALERFGSVDVIVNNAGIGPGRVRPDFEVTPISFTELRPEVVRQYFETHVIAPLALAQAARASMSAVGWGRIVNVTTSLSAMLTAGLGAYGAAKAALEAMTSSIAKEVDGTGITANVLIPGGRADTAMIPGLPNEDRTQLVRPESMVSPLLWLVSCAADATNGRRIRAAAWSVHDGGSDESAIRPIGWPDWPAEAVVEQMEGVQ